MKKLILLCFTLTLIVGCKQEQRYFAESTETSTLKAGIAAYESGDWDKWRSHFADTAKVFVNSSKSVTVEARSKELQEAANNFTSYGFDKEEEYIEMVLDKDKETWVYYWAMWNAELAANKDKISVPVHLAVQFIDGKIVEEHVYFDGSPMNAAFKKIEAANNLPVEDKTIIAKVDSFVDNYLNKQDASVLGGLIADDYVRYMNDVKVATGSGELQTSLAPFFTGFPDFKITNPHRSPIFNNTLFVHWEMTGTNTGEFNGSPATGKKVKISGLSRLHFNGEGKVDEENVFFDQLNLMQQLGKTLN